MVVDEALTQGVKNALARSRAHSQCDCGFTLPKYPGRYPKCCPHCNEPISLNRSDKEPSPEEEL